MKVIRLAVGVEGEYFKRTMNGPLLDFWRYYTGNPNAQIGGSQVSVPIIFKMGFVIGNSGRNWLGDELQLILMPEDAIHATATNNTREIKLSNFYYNIILYYGHTINHKRNVALIFEPGLDVSFMKGYFKFPDSNNNVITYDEAGVGGIGFHIATGVEWVLAKRLTLSGRIGYRHASYKEDHKGPNGYHYFYAIPVADQKRLMIDWKGTYASVGLCYNFYLKMKGMKLE
jgi:hypothetical protein